MRCSWAGPSGAATVLLQPLSGRVLRGPDHAGRRGWGTACAPLSLCLDALSQLFAIRPVWSRNAVRAKISVHPDKLKVLLPFMAYYMVSVCPATLLGSQQGSPPGSC